MRTPLAQSVSPQSGAGLVGATPAEFAALIIEDRARREKVIRGAGIRLQ